MNALKRTARATGAWYLALGITGMLGFLVIRPQLYVEGDTQATLTNLTNNSALAHVGVAVDMAMIVSQAVCALFFYALFVGINRRAAVGIMAFGFMNAAAIMVGTMFTATAIAVAGDGALAPGGDAAATASLLFTLSGSAWAVGNLFFGLWLIPMGWVILQSARMPRVLGWLLIIGGAGYLLSGFVSAAWAGSPESLDQGLSLAASVGEFWMIGYLLWKGIRPAPAVAPGLETSTVTASTAAVR